MADNTTGQAPAIPDEMAEAAARAWYEHEATRFVNPLAWENSLLRSARERFIEWARAALRAALSGRTVVNLPTSYGRHGWDWTSPAGHVEAFTHRGRPRVRLGYAGDWTADDAELICLAGLAAVHRARQLASSCMVREDRTCPAHGDHPHQGMRCLDCPECTRAAAGVAADA